ncbi:hypothetical protein RHSIM_Rhsim04G0090200 [Rhododendron simsii]|uniref:Uncharacterized protein n=1 Tax=Rhododendron simsii TaxID=118357 RepID=A0A834H5E6_RHOSS|nr:hypothetical protein RHSIM_Rhsim04G0090200 [Rhododendron simsii]
MCKVVVMVECKSKISNKAMLIAHFDGVVNEKGHVLIVSHAPALRKEDIVEMNIRKVGDETVWPAVCVAKDLKRDLALLKVEVNEGDEFCILSQEEWILLGKKIFCLSQLSGMPFSFGCGEVPYPHLASGEKGKSFQNRTVNDVKFMWDDGGLRKHLMMINKSSILKRPVDMIPKGTPICGIEGEVIDVFALSISKVSFAITFEGGESLPY